MNNYLNDKIFLKEICSKQNRSISIKITSYNKNNELLEAIEGKVTSGSINIDGASSSRRSCSLTLQTENLNIHDFYWSLTTRFQVELGLLNTTDKYINNKIIWFPMGYYLISSFSISLSTNGTTVSIQGKDKMSMLNGDIGGKLTAETDFGVEDIITTEGNLIHYNIPIKQIIKEAVHQYGQETYNNIIINDLDDYGLNLEVYRGEDPIWILIPVDISSQASELELKTNKDEKVIDLYDNIQKSLEEITEGLWVNNKIVDNSSARIFQQNGISYYVCKISYGETLGYLMTNLIYAGELIGKAGENITNILDKIKSMLGDYEYFYDLNGKFIFQKQKAYQSNGNYQLTTDNDGIIIDYNYEDIDLTLTDLSLLTSLSNNVQINSLKNDFTVWGQKKGVSGGVIPIHMRYAIDRKPMKTYSSIGLSTKDIEKIKEKFSFQSKGLLPSYSYKYSPDKLDWRELIYQMAKDYSKLHYTDEYKYLLEKHNPYCTNGQTGYEQYYTDLLGFWRQLYHPFWDDFTFNETTSTIEDLYLKNTYFLEVDNDLDSLYISNELKVENEEESENNYSSRGTVDDPYYYVGDVEKLSFNFDTDLYVYGPLIPIDGGATRELYGKLDTLLEQNYKILMYFYFSKYYQENENAYEGPEHFKDKCYLYYYDPMTCVPSGWYDKENSLIELKDAIDDFTTYEQAKENDCYHMIDTYGDIVPYYKWDSIIEQSGKYIGDLNLFQVPCQVYRKEYYLDENEEEQETFKLVGSYYPIAPNKKVEYSEVDQYNMANIYAKNYLRQELKKIDPESELSTLKDFEKVFEELINKKNLTLYQQYSIIALYLGIKNYFNQALLSYLREPNFTDTDILYLTETNNLVNKINKDLLIESFFKELFFEKDNHNNNIDTYKNYITDFISKVEIDGNNIVGNDLTDEEIGKIGDYSIKDIYNCFNKIKNFSQSNLSFQIKELSNEEISELFFIFSDVKKNAENKIENIKQEICQKVYATILNDANSLSFQNDWENSKVFKVFNNQYEYSFSAEIVDNDYFQEEAAGRIENDSQKIFSDIDDISFIFNRIADNTDEDLNIKLIKTIIDNCIGEKRNSKKLVTWPQEFNLNTFWHKDVEYSSENLIFWFDFLDNSVSSLQKYSVQNIGQRALVKNDNAVKVIKYPPVQNIVLINNPKDDKILEDNENNIEFTYDKQKVDIFKEYHSGYKYIDLNNYNNEHEVNILSLNNLGLSANGKSAFVAIENLVYNNAYAQESISISCIPQYFLQPNTKIAIYDDKTKINGEYIINKITIPLSYNGTMSISAIRAIDKLERSEITNDK